MQQAPAPAGSPALQRLSDPQAQTPIMPSPELPREGAERSPSSGSSEQVTEDFKFLNCQGCQTQAKCPKLLPCLHTLCSGCLQMPSLRCPVCQAPHSPDETSVLDNVFFESLQRRLAVHKQVVDMQAICTRCKESADFWCFECEQLLCSKCFEAHQWFLKHEARPLAELRSQSVLDFLEGTRKSNNIFCSNPNHRTPTLTSIYCRGCNKPLCCSCALLDSSHSDLKCDLSSEIQQRQDKLAALAHALQEREGVFGATHAQVNEAMEQLARARSEAEKLIQERISQVVAYLKERENELLQAVHTCYQREYKEMASQLRHLDSVLQRIRTGGLLVQRMKRYASDQEVLDMHSFLQGALNSLRLEEPRSQETSAMSTNSLNEIKVRLQDLVSHVTQATDVILSKKVSPELANTPSDLPGAELPDETQKIEGLGLVDAQSMAVVQPEPGAHPVPLYAYSIKDQSNGKKNLDSRPGDKRKSCSTQCSSKMIKLESEKKEEEEEEEWPAWNSPEQPRPSTSSAASESHLDGTPDLGSLVVRNNIAPSHNNHAAGDKDDNTEEAGDVVVLSGSEDSDDTERQDLKHPRTSEPHPPAACPPMSAPSPVHHADAVAAPADHPEPSTANHQHRISFLSHRRLPQDSGLPLPRVPLNPLVQVLRHRPPAPVPMQEHQLSNWRRLLAHHTGYTRPRDPPPS
ncbi:protein PML isoform X3 [Ochotona curzoniae]|uniref:protein PML isoform X3 n=1 Tax=Ochotona curzoniae TaxID=130825 RepID=UPI001B3531DD|nr:protein PML isoform X3 [Ochotona curzoniae]